MSRFPLLVAITSFHPPLDAAPIDERRADPERTRREKTLAFPVMCSMKPRLAMLGFDEADQAVEPMQRRGQHALTSANVFPLAT